MSVITGPWYHLAAIFAAVFLAELGDKTQLATLLFASDRALRARQKIYASFDCRFGEMV